MKQLRASVIAMPWKEPVRRSAAAPDRGTVASGLPGRDGAASEDRREMMIEPVRRSAAAPDRGTVASGLPGRDGAASEDRREMMIEPVRRSAAAPDGAASEDRATWIVALLVLVS